MHNFLVKFLGSLLLVCSFLGLQAQKICIQQEKTDSVLAQNPAILKRLQAYKSQITEWKKSPPTQIQSITTIPVVFHVLYTNEAENVTTQQILRQLDALNADFRHTTIDSLKTPAHFRPYMADTQIEFCLATRSPMGDSTTGINRIPTTVNHIGDTDKYYKPHQGGAQIWDPRYYLNIWVCAINDSVLGYTYLPGVAQPNFDGIVLNYKVCGVGSPTPFPYNKGRTLTHEVGHWLNLQHIWGPQNGCGYDDAVSDTPVQEKANGGCPTGIKTSCNNGPFGDMYMNYMDYTTDPCKNLFTKGQKERMNASINVTRKLLLSSRGCQAPTPKKPAQEIQVYPTPTNNIIHLKIILDDTENINIELFNVSGQCVLQYFLTTGSTTEFLDISTLSNGVYFIKFTSTSIQQTTKIIKQ